MKTYKRDVVEEAQRVMNSNRNLTNKNLISDMTNEIVSLRIEVERLENLLHPTFSGKLSNQWVNGVVYE